jgi:hypothetical protein
MFHKLRLQIKINKEVIINNNIIIILKVSDSLINISLTSLDLI